MRPEGDGREAAGRRLVEACLAGEAGAWETLYREYRGLLFTRALGRLKDREAAEDALQETFLKAWAALPKFNGAYRLGPWLARILENVCTDHGLKEKREREAWSAWAARALPAEPGPEEEAEAALLSGRFGEALASLPEPYRKAFYLRVVMGLSYPEVALGEGITEENARARVSRARRALKKFLGKVLTLLGLAISLGQRGQRAAQALGAGEAGTSASAVPAAPVAKAAIANLVGAALVVVPVAPVLPGAGTAPHRPPAVSGVEAGASVKASGAAAPGPLAGEALPVPPAPAEGGAAGEGAEPQGEFRDKGEGRSTHQRGAGTRRLQGSGGQEVSVPTAAPPTQGEPPPPPTRQQRMRALEASMDELLLKFLERRDELLQAGKTSSEAAADPELVEIAEALAAMRQEYWSLEEGGGGGQSPGASPEAASHASPSSSGSASGQTGAASGEGSGTGGGSQGEG